MYKGTRYRGYVYINPSKMKVIKTVYSDEGIGVDNVYYDNVIHICVYEGKKLLYGKDITKKGHYKIFCVNGKYGIQVEFRIFYFIALQNEEDYERKESSSA